MPIVSEGYTLPDTTAPAMAEKGLEQLEKEIKDIKSKIRDITDKRNHLDRQERQLEEILDALRREMRTRLSHLGAL